MNWTILILSVFGLACAFAWSYWSLAAFRFIQGLGLGGEIPVAATFVSEISKAERRGRFVLLYQLLLPLGFMAASLSSIVIVPNLGWQWMFIVGAAPAFLTIYLRRLVPESPRWLARHGELAKADQIMSDIETIVERESGRPLPPVTKTVDSQSGSGHWTRLFEGIYLRRTITVWIMWFCAATIGYGLLVWLPTIFRTVYKLPLQEALIYSSLSNVTVLISGLCAAFLVDRIGRRPVFVVAFLFGGLPLFILWLIGKEASASTVMLMAATRLDDLDGAIGDLDLYAGALSHQHPIVRNGNGQRLGARGIDRGAQYGGLHYHSYRHQCNFLDVCARRRDRSARRPSVPSRNERQTIGGDLALGREGLSTNLFPERTLLRSMTSSARRPSTCA